MKAFTITSILAAACLMTACNRQEASATTAKADGTAEATAPLPKQDPQLVTGKLDNGLSYYIRPNAEPKGRFSVRLHVNTGSLNETEDIRGISHFLEHMVFNGSPHFKRGEVVPALASVGLDLGKHVNAYTSFDETVYTMDIHNMEEKTVDMALTVLRDFADGALLEEDAINAERGIITSEYKVRDSGKYRLMKDQFAILLDGTKVPHRFPIGTLDMIRNCPREKFLEYYHTHYVPSQMKLVIVGDFTVEKAKAWIDKYFGSMKKDNYDYKTDPGQLKAISEMTSNWLTNNEVTSTDISLNVVSTYDKQPDSVAQRNKDIPLKMAYAMLNRRLSKMAKDKNCPFTSATAGNFELFEIAEIDSINANCEFKNWEKALPIIEQELRRAIEFGFTAQELEEARRNSISAAENSIKSWATYKSEGLATAIMNNVAKDIIFTTPEEDWAITKDTVLNLTPEQCQTALKKAWQQAPPRLMVTSNHEMAQGEQKAMAIYKASAATKLDAYKSDEIKPFSYELGTPGKVVTRTEDKDLNLTQLTLSNGVRVNLKPTEFDKDSVNITFAIDGGSITRPEKAGGLDMFAGALYSNGGLKNHSTDELRAVMAGKRVGVGFNIGERQFVFSGSTNNKDLKTQLELMTASVMYPGYREDGLIQLFRTLPIIFAQLEKEPSGVMATKVPALMYKNNPRFTFPTQEQLKSYTVQDAKAWIEPQLQNNYMEVTVTGDFKPEVIIPMLESTVGAMPRRADAPAKVDEKLSHPDMIPFNSAKDLEYKSTIDKTLVAFFWKCTGADDKAMVRRLTLLEGILDARMFKGIREDMGETYSPSTGLEVTENYPDCGYFRVMSFGVMRNKEAVGKAIAKIGTGMASGNITAEELDRSRNVLLNKLARAQRQNAYWQNMLSDCQVRPDRLQQHKIAVDDLKSVTVEEINELAKKIFGKSEYLNLNILPDNPTLETPPAEKREATPKAEPTAAPAAAFCVHATPSKKPVVHKKETPNKRYVVLISEKTNALPEWKAVAQTLAAKHKGKVVTVKDSIFTKKDELKKMAPRYMALVAQPEEVDRNTVNDLHRLTRQLDEDAYGDCIWGIITGYTPADAMRIVKTTEPLIITRSMGTTNVDAARFEKSMCITDWQPYQFIEKKGDETNVQPVMYEEGLKNQQSPGSLGVTPKLLEYWTSSSPQLFVTSSHATQYNLEMPFGKGIIVSGDNRFYALTTKQFREFTTFLGGALFTGKEEDLQNFLKRANPQVIKIKPTPAVWIASGNCLIGDTMKTKNSMVVTALSAYGFNQFVGYTVPSWYGKGGWGTLSMFFSNHDASSLAESWYLNNQFILDETVTKFPKLMNVHFNGKDIQSAIQTDREFGLGLQRAGYGAGQDQIGLVHDRDVVAFYGDPAWIARPDESKAKSPWHISWNDPTDAAKGFTVTANNDNKGRLGVWFPNKIKVASGTITVNGHDIPVEKDGLLTNDFLLLRNLNLKKGEKAVISFK